MNVAAFKRCLPALQQIARFPNCNRAYVCRKRMMDLNEVESVIRDALAELELRIWNEEALAGAAKIHGIKVPEYRPDMTSPPAPPEPIDNPPPVAVRAVGARAGCPRGSVVEKVLRAGKSLPHDEPAPPPVLPEKPIYLKVCTELLAHPEYSDSEAYRRADVCQGSWAYFKKKNFKSGRTIEPEALRAILERMGGEIREPKAPPKSLGSSDSAPNGASEGSQPAPQIRGLVQRAPSILKNEVCGAIKLSNAELARKYSQRGGMNGIAPADCLVPDKERRHLVASFAIGLMSSEYHRPLDLKLVIGEAFQLFDELVSQDQARGKAARKEGA